MTIYRLLVIVPMLVSASVHLLLQRHCPDDCPSV